MMKFSYQYTQESPLIEFTLNPESTLDTVVEEFERFLKAAGYVYGGELDIVTSHESELNEKDLEDGDAEHE